MIVDASYKKFEESIEKALKPKRSFEQDLEVGRKFLPLCLNDDKLKMFLTEGYEGRGAVDMAKFKRLTGFARSYAYEIRTTLSRN